MLRYINKAKAVLVRLRNEQHVKYIVLNIRKIHILYLIDGLFAGGKERQFIELLKGIDRNMFKIGIVTFNKDLFYSERAKELSDYFVELDKRKNKFKPFFTVWKCFRQFKPDIIHSWDYLSSMYAYLPAKLKGAKFINGSIRDSGVEKGWQNKVKKIMLRLADVVISNSAAGLKNYGISNGFVIYNAVNQQRFSEKESTNEFNIIKVANFTDYKDHNSFTEAAISLVKKGIVDKVFYAGEGKQMEKCKQMVKDSCNDYEQHFYFLGSISNVEEYLKKCTVGVLCSTVKYSEGVSNSVLEYMAASLIPIVTDIGASSEIITNKANGFLINPSNIVDELIEKIELIKSDKSMQESLIVEAKKTISKKFNYASNIDKLITVYTDVLSR